MKLLTSFVILSFIQAQASHAGQKICTVQVYKYPSFESVDLYADDYLITSERFKNQSQFLTACQKAKRDANSLEKKGYCFYIETHDCP